MTQRTTSSLSLLQQESTAQRRRLVCAISSITTPVSDDYGEEQTFLYRGVDGRPIRDPAILRRIEIVGDPPATLDGRLAMP